MSPSLRRRGGRTCGHVDVQRTCVSHVDVDERPGISKLEAGGLHTCGHVDVERTCGHVDVERPGVSQLETGGGVHTCGLPVSSLRQGGLHTCGRPFAKDF